MSRDDKVKRLQREIASGERLLLNLLRRRDREPAVRESCYRLKAALSRRKLQLKRI